MVGIFAAWAVPCLQMMPGNDVAYTWTRQFSGRLTGEDFKFGGWILNIPRGLGYFLPWTLLLFVARRAFGEEMGNAERRTSNVERRTGESDDGGVPNSTFGVRRSTFGVQSGLAWGIAISFLAVSLLPGALARYTMPLLVPASWLVASILATKRFELPHWLRARWPSAVSAEVRLPAIVAGLACGAMLIYAVALMPVLRKREKVRNIAAQINRAVPANEPLYAIDPDYQPALFYVRDPIIYLGRVSDVPPAARFVLVQPAHEAEARESEQWAPRKARPLLRLRDYRKKEIVVLAVEDGKDF